MHHPPLPRLPQPKMVVLNFFRVSDSSESAKSFGSYGRRNTNMHMCVYKIIRQKNPEKKSILRDRFLENFYFQQYIFM